MMGAATAKLREPKNVRTRGTTIYERTVMRPGGGLHSVVQEPIARSGSRCLNPDPNTGI